MQRSCELTIFPISPLHKSRLYNAGYQTTADLEHADAVKLSKETGLSPDVCKSLLEEIQKHDPARRKASRLSSACAQYRREREAPGIVTFSEQIDGALGGGVQLGRLTEICGVPGVGKTQLCMQLACDVQIPAIFGGSESEAVYIDAERTLIIDRLRDIVKSTVEHCHQIAGSGDEELLPILKEFTEEKILSRIHYYGCHDYQTLLAIVHHLPELLKKHKKAKLVLIDSVAFHFRHSFEDMSLRTRLLTNLAQTLVKTAKKHDIAISLVIKSGRVEFLSPVYGFSRTRDKIVVTNHMTTKVGEKTSRLVPALGESWGHACSTRIILQLEGEQRLAWLYKSPSQRQQKVPFQITTDGIRDVITESIQDMGSCSDEENPPKRQRTC